MPNGLTNDDHEYAIWQLINSQEGNQLQYSLLLFSFPDFSSFIN